MNDDILQNGNTKNSSDGDDEEDDWDPEPLVINDKIVSSQMAKLTMNKDLDKTVSTSSFDFLTF